MKPDSFKSQLQAVLTAYYEDVKGVHGASSCPKTKIVKCRLEEQEDAGTTTKDGADKEDRTRSRSASRQRCRGCPPRQRCRGCSPRQGCSCCSPAGGEEPVPVPALAESAPNPAGKAGGRGGKETKGCCLLN